MIKKNSDKQKNQNTHSFSRFRYVIQQPKSKLDKAHKLTKNTVTNVLNEECFCGLSSRTATNTEAFVAALNEDSGTERKRGKMRTRTN